MGSISTTTPIFFPIQQFFNFICIDHGIIYYDNDISSIVSNDRIIEAWQQCKKCDGGKKKKGRRTSSGFVLLKIVLIFLKIRISIFGALVF